MEIPDKKYNQLVSMNREVYDTRYRKLRQLRKINDIILDEIALKTGLSVGYLNRIERGYIAEIKNVGKRKKLENYIKKLERKTKRELAQEPLIG